MKQERIEKIVRQAIEEHIFPGCVVGYSSEGEQTVLPFGNLTYDSFAPKVEEETLYDVASITKSVPTSMLALFLLERKLISLHDPVIRFIPEFVNSFREKVTLFHLLTHTVEFDLQLSLLKDASPREILATLFTTNLRKKPGTSFSYVNAASILLGLVVERVSGKKLDTFAEEIYFAPLGMKQTTFSPVDISQDLIAPSEIDAWRGKEIRGVVHDESAYTLRSAMVPGSAGLFSTVPDLLVFLQMILAGGEWKGKRYLSENLIRAIETNQIPFLEESTGLGWELSQSWYMGQYITPHTFGKTGFTGCHVVCDRKKGTILILLSNSCYPTRPKSKDKINALRRKLSDVVFAD